MFQIDPNDISQIERQWKTITLVQWDNVQDTQKFWAEVSMYVDASGFNPFKEMTFCAREILTIPHSNAEVERVFSTINILKCKQRNKIGYELLNVILRIRAGLNRVGKNCHTYVFPESFRTKKRFSARNLEENKDSEEENLKEVLILGQF